MRLPAESATGELSYTEYPTGQLAAIIKPIVACLDEAGAKARMHVNNYSMHWLPQHKLIFDPRQLACTGY